MAEAAPIGLEPEAEWVTCVRFQDLRPGDKLWMEPFRREEGLAFECTEVVTDEADAKISAVGVVTDEGGEHTPVRILYSTVTTKEKKEGPFVTHAFRSIGVGLAPKIELDGDRPDASEADTRFRHLPPLFGVRVQRASR